MITFNLILFFFCVAVLLGFFVLGLDDLFFDYVFLTNSLRRFKYRKQINSFDFENVLRVPEKKIAVFVPCWQEEGIVDKMVDNALRTIRYKNYAIFIGCYPNDPGTIESAKAAALRYPNVYVVDGNHVSVVSPPHTAADPPVYVVIGENPGPTNKADNLNQCFNAMRRVSNPLDPFEFVIMHDSEDLIHPDSFSLHNYLISKGKHMVQIPVLPLPTKATDWVHWTYVDEFAEHHSRTLVVRERVGGFVPSAGTGTSYTLEALSHLAQRNGEAFNTNSLTEDYQSGLDLEQAGYQTVFVQMAGPDERMIATRAYFPRSFKAAVRQRTRWMTGISLQAWDNMGGFWKGWGGDAATKYCLFRDRKILVTGGLNLCGYLIVLLVLLQPLFHYDLGALTTPPWIWLVYVNAIMAIWRLMVRAWVVWKLYGWSPALLVAPRAVLGNVINFGASWRSLYGYLWTHKVRKQRLTWDKTVHEFPEGMFGTPTATTPNRDQDLTGTPR